MPDPSTALATDRLVGNRYRLIRLVARGGMAEVWEAEDTVLGRPVAVKALHRHLAADDAFLQRFRREAVAAARLSHPHIVAIYDTCAGDDCEAIVMELVRGSTLRDLLDERGALEPSQAVDIALQVADALTHAHLAGLVHRDVKPGNILLADDGRVLVTDFGIAKAAEVSSDLTEVGEVVGTAKYLAPEQVQGEPVDPRSDVYALGVVLYEMVCGRPPFEAANSTATALARLTRDPLRPRQVRAGIPRSLEDLVLRAMARKPDDRFPTAVALGRALEGVDVVRTTGADSESVDVVVDPTTVGKAASFARSERSWLVPTALILVVALTLGVVGYLVGGTDVGKSILDAVGGDDDDLGGGELTPVRFSLTSLDPPPSGDGEENDGLLALARDGRDDTDWHTDQYNTRRLGGLKPGVGIVLTPESAGELRRLELTSNSRGWQASVYVTAQASPNLAGWGTPVATADGATTTIDLGGRKGVVLLWITDLGEAARFELQEVKLLA